MEWEMNTIIIDIYRKFDNIINKFKLILISNKNII